jgi:hypothetical protein
LTVHIQSPENHSLKSVQLAIKRIELEKLKETIVSRAVVNASMQEHAAMVRSMFMSLPARIRQSLKLTMNQQNQIEGVVDALMAEALKGEWKENAKPNDS